MITPSAVAPSCGFEIILLEGYSLWVLLTAEYEPRLVQSSSDQGFSFMLVTRSGQINITLKRKISSTSLLCQGLFFDFCQY